MDLNRQIEGTIREENLREMKKNYEGCYRKERTINYSLNRIP